MGGKVLDTWQCSFDSHNELVYGEESQQGISWSNYRWWCRQAMENSLLASTWKLILDLPCFGTNLKLMNKSKVRRNEAHIFFSGRMSFELSGWIKFAWVFSNLENTCKYYLRSGLLFCCDTCNSFYIFKFHYMIDDTAQLYEFGLLVSVLNGIFIVKLLLLYCITKSVFYPYTFTCNLTVLKFIHFQLMEIYFSKYVGVLKWVYCFVKHYCIVLVSIMVTYLMLRMCELKAIFNSPFSTWLWYSQSLQS